MKFKIGEKVVINTVDDVHKKIVYKDHDFVKSINFNFFREYGNKTAIVDEIDFDNDIILVTCEEDPIRLQIPEKHHLISFKKCVNIELNDNLFKL